MNDSILVSAILMGVFGSTHCAAMCGGISGVLSGGLVTLGKRPAPRLSLHLGMSAGRVATYALLGAALGGLGSTVSSLSGLGGLPLVLRAIAGLSLVLVGLHLAGITQSTKALERWTAPIWRRAEPLARRLLPVRTVSTSIAFGALWGLMPCGLVYAALGLAVATGSALDGLVTMALFGLGTVPALLLVGALVRLVAKLTAHAGIRRFAGATVVLLGVLNVASVAAMAGAPPVPGTPVCCAHGSRP